MNTYQVESHNCHLQVYEKGNENSKVGILFLHGGPGSGAKTMMELDAFKQLEEYYQCIYFDQRGSGFSEYDLSLGLTIQDIVNDVYRVTKQIKKHHDFDKLILWGGSFGGCLASLCLETYPMLFDKCILSSPAITFNQTQALDFFNRMQAPYQKRMNATEIYDKPELFFSNPETRKFIFSESNPSQSLKHICAMSSWFFSHTFEHLFKDIKIPTLILQGEDDPICIIKNIEEEMKNNDYPFIDYVVFKKCGHAVFEDKKEEFIENIIKFIGGK